MVKAKFFKSKAELRRWFVKNHNKTMELWIGLYKGSHGSGELKQAEVIETLLCYGWSFGAIKGIDQWTYRIKVMRRKNHGVWSFGSIQAAKKLKKQGLMHASGWTAFTGRNKKKSEEKLPEFTPQQLKIFKQNPVAWNFFSRQTDSYRRYTTWWVISAVQEQTKQRRLQELIRDSGQESKLARILVAINKVKKVYEPGKTPVEEGKNIGQVVGTELRSVGIDTLEILQSVGWEDAFHRLCEMYPHRVNINAVTALIGAVENTHRFKIDAAMRAEGMALVREMKRGL